MTAYRPPFQLCDTAPIALADHPPPSISYSRYLDPRSAPYVNLEPHPKPVIKRVQLSTEFLLKPQSQSHSGLAPHFLNFAALHGKSSLDQSEEDSISQNLDPWLTTANLMNTQDGQTYQTSGVNVDEYLGFVEAADFLSPAFNPPSMLPPPYPDHLYENHRAIPVLPLAAHQPIPPEQHSTYSELAPHLEFMEKMQQQEPKGKPVTPPLKVRHTRRRSPKLLRERGSTFPSPIERSRKPKHHSGSSKILGRTAEYRVSKLPKSDPTPFLMPPLDREPMQESFESSEVGPTSSRNHKEPKRPQSLMYIL